MDVAELINLGMSMNLESEELSHFIKDQQNRMRDERSEARSAEKDRETLKLEQIKSEHELENIRASLERDKMSHDLELARIQATTINTDQSKCLQIEKPRLPMYDENEDISSYLIRFERMCRLVEIPPNSYAIRLGSLLKGKAAELYSSLSDETTSDYNSLKHALLLGFNKTADSYRIEFRTLKRSTETYAQFATELSRKLNFWLKCSDVTETYEDLHTFILLDQFISSLPVELRTFLKERGTRTLSDATKAADDWTSAHHTRTAGHNNRIDRQRKYDSSEKPNPSGGITCYSCGVRGHVRSNCPTLFQSNSNGDNQVPEASPTYKVAFDFNSTLPSKYMSHGTINGANVSKIIRDTGCGGVVVSSDVVPHAQLSKARKGKLSDYLGRVNEFPMLKCYVHCDFYTGWVEAVVAPLKCCSILLGNIPGVKDPLDLERNPSINQKRLLKSTSKINVLAVTRSQGNFDEKNVSHPLVTKHSQFLDITPEIFETTQKDCPTLKTLWNKASAKETIKLKDGSIFKFTIKDNLLYRECIYSPNKRIIGRVSLVLPEPCRAFVLKTAHECPIAGHFSHTKTFSKISDHFFWPGASTDIKNHCRSCDVCQRMSVKKVPPVPLRKMPIVDVPFARVSMDIVGPINPQSSNGHKYVLTLIDWTTGFPEAVPLKKTDSISVAEALLTIFARVGIPKEILSDQGTNFISKLMGELHSLLGVKPLFSSIYHAQGNGRVERLHLTLKSCLRKLCIDKPQEWHRYLTAVLFAIRELPSDRTGMSPFELLYGRKVRGPISVLRDLWSNTSVSYEERDSYQYVIDLRQRIEACVKIAQENSKASQSKFSSYFDLKAKDRKLEVGDEALVLLPDSTNKLLVCWKGPFKIIKRLNRVNYLLQCDGVEKTYHINLLRKYFRRGCPTDAKIDESNDINESIPRNVLFIAHATYIDENCLDIPTSGKEIVLDKDLCIEHCSTDTDCNKYPVISESLSTNEKKDVLNIIESFNNVFSSAPGFTNTVIHKIQLNSSEPICSKVYPVPVHLRDSFNAEVEKLLELGIIQRSTSNYRSPVVMVAKTDGSLRLTVDFRHLNSFSKLDSEPAFNPDDDIHNFYGSIYFSELDICKAYHQVELDSESRHLTAFPTHLGLMEYTRLPFGLNSACATYARLMRIVLEGIKGVTYYFDNILVYSKSWSEHILTLRSVLVRLQSHGLTARPDKCFIGFGTIKYLGFEINRDSIAPLMNKVDTITNSLPPSSKKGLRSFLGLLSFYRRFILNLASVTAPLTELLKTKIIEPLTYTPEQLYSFEESKKCLVSSPILKLPNVTIPFVIRTDASGIGIGGILLQYYDDFPFPVSYASRQLTTAEKKYSTVERECLAIIFTLQRFAIYLIGKEFMLEVDHRPLVYLNKMKNLNSRLARWALCLQPFKFSVVYLPGAINVGADYMSRLI